MCGFGPSSCILKKNACNCEYIDFLIQKFPRTDKLNISRVIKLVRFGFSPAFPPHNICDRSFFRTSSKFKLLTLIRTTTYACRHILQKMLRFFLNLIDLMDYCSRSFLNIVLWDYRHPSWFIWNFIASKCEENNFWTFSILLFSIFNNFNVEPKPIIAPVIHQFGLRGIFAKLSTWWARWISHFSSGFVKFRQFSLVRQNVRICPDGIKRT